MDEFKPEAEREERAEQEENLVVPLVNQDVAQNAVKNETKPATRRSLRVKGDKADLASLPYKGRPL